MKDDLTARLIEAVADATDTPPMDLTPLNDVIDPDALGQLVASGDDDLRATVEYAGVRVTIAGTGEIVSVTPLSASPEPADAGEESPGVASD